MLRRAAFLTVGCLAVVLGTIGIVVLGLPTTGFFVLAAACFARSSPRFERWVLDLPTVGPMVRDYPAGLGMPRRAKVIAITMMVAACSLSAWAVGVPSAWPSCWPAPSAPGTSAGASPPVRWSSTPGRADGRHR